MKLGGIIKYELDSRQNLVIKKYIPIIKSKFKGKKLRKYKQIGNLLKDFFPGF